MPIRQGYEAGAVLTSGQMTPGLSDDLDDYEFDAFGPGAYLVSLFPQEYKGGAVLRYFIAKSAATIKSGYRLNNWSDDWYDHIYITPTFIDLGTIASPQTRTVELWNAWRDRNAILNSIDIDGTPVEVDGLNMPVYNMRPLKYDTYTITVGTTGAPAVNAEITFNFSNVPDPQAVIVIGTRAVRFGLIPEVPVNETWRWLTDVMVATDGTEQRMAVRGTPRVEMDFNAVFVSRDEIMTFYAQLLTSAGRLWVPEYQYMTLTTANSLPGTTTVYLNTDATDIRPGEYVLIDTKAASFLSEVASVGAGFIVLVSPLDYAVPKGAMVAPGAPCLLDDGTQLSRYAPDWAGEVTLNCRLQRYRDAIMRPGVAEVMTTYNGSKVLEKRPLAPGLVDDAFFTGQENQDGNTGAFDILTNWDYTRIGGQRSFKINRVRNPSEMDYWREFFSWARGMARMFWMSTYRSDFTFATPPLQAGTTATLVGEDYALKFYGTPTHRFLELTTAAGIHRCEVTNAVASAGNTGIQFTPALPLGDAGWEDIKRVSLLLPLRLNSDDIKLRHYGLETMLEMNVRTAEAQP